MKPYTDIEVTDKYIIREFNENIDPIELLWHRDSTDRTLEILGETNWRIQLDNKLPILLENHIFIMINHTVNSALLENMSSIPKAIYK